jgi:hypothetical protein
MDAYGLFNELVRRISIALKPFGFSRKQQTFFCRKGDNWGLITIQKSKNSDRQKLDFAVNIGVASGALLKFSSPEREDVIPTIEDCHWRDRLGAILSGGSDKWWTLHENDSVKRLADEISNDLVSVALPRLEQYGYDEGLRDLWASGMSPGLTDLSRMMNLSVLLCTIGPSERLDNVIDAMESASRGKPTAAMVDRHVRSLKQFGQSWRASHSRD